MGQKERILEYIAIHGSITGVEAFLDLGIMRLPARIFDLKKMGYVFTTMPVTGKNRFGEPFNSVRYFLEKKTKDS